MSHEFTTKSVLHQLGIGKSYKGYDYILHAINMISHDESLLHCVTKILYIDIARAYLTSSTCVERNIRKVIEVIWNHNQENMKLIINIFGLRYVSTKPSNKEFLDLLYHYVNTYECLDELLTIDKLICPISQEICPAYYEIFKKLQI